MKEVEQIDETDLQDQFRQETGEQICIQTTDGVNQVLISVINPKYVGWLERKLNGDLNRRNEDGKS